MISHRVFGAGLIGGFVAGALLKRGQTVSVVARPQVRKKLEGGLLLTDLEGHQARVPSPDFAPQAPAPGDRAPDYLWLTVKCTSVIDAVPDLERHLGPGTVLICCQNGLGSEGPVKAAFPGNTVLRGMVAFNVAEPAPGHFHRGSGGSLIIEADPGVSELPAAVSSGLMPVELSTEMDAVLWAKLQLNLVNAVNALSDVPVREMLGQRGYRRVFAACMRELLAVTGALGVALPRLTALPPTWLPPLLSQPDWLFTQIAKSMLEVDPTVRTSMWWDISQGKATEIDYLNGNVVAAGRRNGIPTPVNEHIIRLVKAAESEHHSPGLSPERLLQETGLD